MLGKLKVKVTAPGNRGTVVKVRRADTGLYSAFSRRELRTFAARCFFHADLRIFLRQMRPDL